MYELLNHISPEFILSVIAGGIIWGVQLNISVLLLSRRAARHDTIIEEHTNRSSQLAHDMVRVSLILSQVEKDVGAALTHVETHEKESESWKQRIVAAERDLEALKVDNYKSKM